MAACEATSFNTAIRVGLNTRAARLFFEIERADEPGLVHQRQAENRTGPLLPDIGVCGERRLGHGIVKENALSGAQHMIENRLGQQRRTHPLIA
nr:hypothetical protein GCM10020185_79970 [Pseudomonas brassicacearum subsp. brassicacearum]